MLMLGTLAGLGFLGMAPLAEPFNMAGRLITA